MSVSPILKFIDGVLQFWRQCFRKIRHWWLLRLHEFGDTPPLQGIAQLQWEGPASRGFPQLGVKLPPDFMGEMSLLDPQRAK